MTRGHPTPSATFHRLRPHALGILMDDWRTAEAENCRTQAAGYRDLAARARTPAGNRALHALAKRFDDEARRLNPRSEMK